MKYPTASCGASDSIKQPWLTGGLLLYLILDIPPYQVRSNPITYTTNKIPITPQLSRPELVPQLRESLEYFSPRYALHNLNYFRRRIPRWSLQKHVNMVFHYFHRVYCEFIFIRCLLQYLLCVPSNLSHQYMSPVLRYPHKVVLQIKNGMLRPSNPHAALIRQILTLEQAPTRRLTATRFPPASKLTGIQRGSL